MRVPHSILALAVLLAAAVALVAVPASWAWEPPPAELGRVARFDLPDLEGRRHTEQLVRGAQATVVVFLGSECPVSNGYAPQMQRLADAFAARGVSFVGVYVEPEVTSDVARRHAAEYGLKFTLLLDPHQALAAQAGVRRMPECVVLKPDGTIAYRGRIDNRYAMSGKRRLEATTHDLADAVDAVLAGRSPEPNATETFGCPLPKVK